MQYYLNLAKQKKLNKAEMNSLMTSIKRCTDFGFEARDFIESRQLKSSIIYQYILQLQQMGIPITIFRETKRYRFMLALTLQQSWKFLQPIFERTSFFDFSIPKVIKCNPQDPFETAYSRLISGDSEENVANFIRGSFIFPIRHILIFHAMENVIIICFIRTNTDFKIFNVFSRFGGHSLIPQESNDDFVHFEVPSKGKNSVQSFTFLPHMLLTNEEIATAPTS